VNDDLQAILFYGKIMKIKRAKKMTDIFSIAMLKKHQNSTVAYFLKKINATVLGGTHVLTINVRIRLRSKHRNSDFPFQSFCLLRRKKDFHSIVAAIHPPNDLIVS